VQDGILLANPNLRANKIFPIHFRSRYVRPFARILNAKYSRFKNFDLIHSTYYLKEYLPRIPIKRHIITIHDMIPDDFPEYFNEGSPHDAKFEYIARSAGIICVSEYTKDRLLSHCPEIPRDNISVVYHGSKYSSQSLMFEDIWSKSKIKQNLNQILYVGSRLGYKNFKILLAAGKILKESGLPFRIVCAGGGSFTDSEIETIGAYGLANLVHQMNVSDSELKELYLTSLCHVTTSHVEGFGLPLLEAMSLGCPSIISTATALQEVSNGNSLTFEPTNEIDLANRILELTSDLVFRKELAFSGFQRSKHFSWESTAYGTIAAYNKIIGE